ncbi:carboxylate--amine ligase [Halobaculum sp. MBLA0147]|uniref:carboxylate--amine ligase n=1 Tax=Halobaculum sp. MBLA0147 TaxID=3079934 RepID=UPI0035260B74
MADRFRGTDELVATLADATFEQPPAVVANAHVTGVSVARALSALDVPVIAVDRNGDGVAPSSTAVDYAGEVRYPLDDPDGFETDLARVVDAVGTDVVAFGCMDEWVRAFAAADVEGLRLPFDPDAADRVLDKATLYRLADEHGVPYPETRDLTETDADAAIEAVGGFPLVIKPARKRKFEEAFGTNVVEASDRAEFDETVAAARDADARVLVQEKVPVETGRDTSLASYVPPSDGASYAGVGRRGDDDPLTRHDALGVVGNAAVRFPQGFGTSCLVETVDRPAIAERALTILDETGYHGISEAEFVYDADRETYVLLDVNTRPWKWVSAPVEAGANLPAAAYCDAVPESGATLSDTDGDGRAVAADGDTNPPSGDDTNPPSGDDTNPPSGDDTNPSSGDGTLVVDDARWVFLPDYLELCATTPGFRDVLSRAEWTALLSGAFETERGLTTGVYRPSDPEPAVTALERAFGVGEYYCAC